MVVTREDAENLLSEISGEFLRKVQKESLKPSKIRYFDEHRVVEVKFPLWRRYVNRKEYGISYMWTVYLRTQKIRYGLAISCASADASERALIKLFGEDTIKSLKERGLSIMRLDRTVILGKEIPLDAFEKPQKEESLNLMLEVHSFISNRVATFEESLCFEEGNDPLIEALRGMKTLYWREWENKGKPLIEKAREEVIKFAKGESGELSLPSDTDGDAGRLLWFVAGGLLTEEIQKGLESF